MPGFAYQILGKAKPSHSKFHPIDLGGFANHRDYQTCFRTSEALHLNQTVRSASKCSSRVRMVAWVSGMDCVASTTNQRLGSACAIFR